ncbi:MAG TPA: PAS domain-containing protein [Pseudomonadales bacterium]
MEHEGMLKETLLRLIQRLAKVGGWAITLDGSGAVASVHWTPGTYEIYEHDGPAPLDFAAHLQCIQPAYRELAMTKFAACNSGEPIEYEMEIVTSRGKQKFVRIVAEPELDEHGAVVRVAGAVQDITPQKRAEQEKRVLSQRLFDAFESMTDAFYLVDRHWRLVYINDAADKLVGGRAKPGLGRTLWEAFPNLIGTPLYDGFHQALRDNQPYHSEYYSELMQNWIEMNAYPSAEGLAVYFRTVTVQKAMAARIAASERRLNFVTLATLDAAWDWNLENDRIWWSGGLERLFGYENLPGAPELETPRQFWVDQIHDDDRGTVLASISRVLDGDARTWEERYRFKHRNGNFVHVEHRGFVVRDDRGRAQQLVGGITDISERVLLEQRMLQSQRLESVGKLTGHVAHDFNNLLTVILGNAELLQLTLAENRQATELASMISNAAVRGSDLTRRLLAFARKQTLAPRSVDINELVDNMRAMLERTLGVDIAIHVHTTPDLHPALVDAHQLEGALLNLCLNARDAMPGGGTLMIETSNVFIESSFPDDYRELEPGEYVVLAVTDTGTGIEPEHIKHVFEPFFTTKPSGKGTGLGLSSVFGFVKQSNGTISIYSEPGAGTTVMIYLPVALTTATNRNVNAGAAASRGGSETILLVEDDDQVRDLAANLLGGALGYTVHVRPDATSALAFLDAGAPVDLVFTDVMMPGMNGRDFARLAQLQRPGLKVLFTSGFSEHDDLPGTGFNLLAKPYSISELARKVREVLDGA